MMDIKERSRERMELRIHAKETLKAVVEWIEVTNPQNWLPAGGKEKANEDILSKDELKSQFRDYVDKAGKLIEKVWRPAELLVQDLTNLMEEVVAESKGTSKAQ
jgi:hypothetical protein